jgi:hypothetical protein
MVDAALRKLLRSRSLGRIWLMRDGAKAVGYVVLTFTYLEFGGLEGIVTDLFIRSEYRTRGLRRHALADGSGPDVREQERLMCNGRTHEVDPVS